MHSAHRSTLVFPCTLAFALAGTAFAQTTAPATPTSHASAELPETRRRRPAALRPSSARPPPSRSDNNWMTRHEGLSRMRQGVHRRPSGSGHRRMSTAANAAIEEYNKSVKTLNEADRGGEAITGGYTDRAHRRCLPPPRRWSREPRLQPTRRMRSPSRCSKASTTTTRCSANARAPRSGISRRATGSRSSTWPAIASTSTTAACWRPPSEIEREFRSPAEDADRDAPVGAGQAPLHRPPDRPQAARVRRDVLQLGVGEDRCTACYYHNRFIFVRPAISTEHIDADPPSYRSYYPLQQGLRNALIDIVLDFGFERRFADFGGDLAQRARRVPPPLPAAVPPRGQSSDPGAVVAVLPQPDGVHRRPRRQRRAHLSVRRAGEARRRGQALLRRAADGRSRSRDPVLRQPRVLPRRHGGARRRTSISCGRSWPTRPRPSSTRWSGCRRRARTSSSATSSTTSSTRATSSSSRRASRAS